MNNNAFHFWRSVGDRFFRNRDCVRGSKPRQFTKVEEFDVFRPLEVPVEVPPLVVPVDAPPLEIHVDALAVICSIQTILDALVLL